MIRKSDSTATTVTPASRYTPPKPSSRSTERTRPASPDRARISRDSGRAGATPDFSSWASQPGLLRTGMDNERVRGLQQSLRDQGYDIKVDGKFGPQTESVVKQFQAANKLADDGLVGPPTSRPTGDANKPRKPIDSFTFRSNPQDPEKVKRLILDNNAKGKSTMVGIDPNNGPAAQKKLLQVARENGAKTHLYLEGRGGPTGQNGWEASEWQRTKQAAANLKEPIHLTSQKDSHPAMQEWNQRGWQEHSIKQARQAKKDGFDSVEVDNINRLDSGDNTRRTMDFYRQYASEFAKGDMPTLMMKNQTIDELKSVRTAIDNYQRTKDMTPEQLANEPASVRNNRIPREMFSDYHIFENDGGDLKARHIELTQALGIKLLQSKDTNNYGASGNFRP